MSTEVFVVIITTLAIAGAALIITAAILDSRSTKRLQELDKKAFDEFARVIGSWREKKKKKKNTCRGTRYAPS